ncbi:MAG TPA: site-2 protease family protein [Candidatus Eisenbacteria bacterium]|nr:site-2 protease family protein [Candidatus Eisenbacteria bacterium]
MGDVTGILLMIPPLLFALTFHEYCHALVATRLGDPTARLLGRLTLNPIAHLDPVGTLVFVLTQRIGWAKPVPIDERYLKHPRRDIMWIALAGPVSNLVLAFLFGTIVRFAAPIQTASAVQRLLLAMVEGSVIVNLGLAAFNLIPIFPLDGSRILTGLLSREWAERYRELDRVGPFILLGIVVLGMTTGVNLFSYVVYPIIYVLGRIFTGGVL